MLTSLPLLLFVSLTASAEPCLQGIKSFGAQDLRRPWPVKVHEERHAQIQEAIARSARSTENCFERYGDLPGPIVFSISGENIKVDDSTVRTPTGACLAAMLRSVQLPEYPCDMNVAYQWDGKLPLVNVERKTY